jgi:signal transduction histidine kinase
MLTHLQRQHVVPGRKDDERHTTAQFDRLARLLAHSVQAPIAMISLVNTDHQHLVGISGVAEPWASVRRTPLSASFCRHVVALESPLLVDEVTPDSASAVNLAGPELGLVAYAGVPLRSPRGKVVGTVCVIDQTRHNWRSEVLGFLADIAELATNELGRLNNSQAQAHNDAERANYEQALLLTQRLACLGVLAGGAAHDFNNLLVAMIGNAELALLALPDSATAAENIHNIIMAARTAAELAQQMLVYAGRRKGRVETIDGNELIRDMWQLLVAAVPRSITLVHEAGQMPLHFCANEVQLQQVLINLVLNAAEAIEAGQGTITLRTSLRLLGEGEWQMPQSEETLPQGCYIVIEVEDTGCGMSPDLMARIFEPFVTTKARGHGLGLAVVLGVVRQHKGGVQLQSIVGAGTRFSVAFPCA